MKQGQWSQLFTSVLKTLPVLDQLSQGVLLVSSQCTLRCWGCDVWENSTDKNYASRHALELIRGGTFFSVFPKRAYYHLIGGDPLCSEDLKEIMTFFQKQNISIFLWTHGLFPLARFEAIKHLKYQPVLYLPVPDTTEYRVRTGQDGWIAFQETLAHLISNRKTPILQFPVKPDTIDYLPYAYEFAFERNLKLWIHYNTQDLFKKDSIGYITRFHDVANVWIFKNQRINPSKTCIAVPIKALQDPIQLCRNLVHDGINFIRKRIGL